MKRQDIKINLFKTKIWLKTYKFEVITTVVDIALVALAATNKENFFVFTGSLAVIIISFFVVLYLRSRDKAFYFLPLDKESQANEWIGRGDWKFNRTEKCFEISNSNVGYLFPKTLLWDDYSLEFDFKIIESCCAWIVRAQNLSNYVMLQCGNDRINPHIRLDGQWMIIGKEETTLSFKQNLSLDNWYKASLTCDKRNIRIQIYSQEAEIFNRQWTIPNQLIWEASIEGQEQPIRFFREIDFDFGGIGFRDHPGEKAFIKNVYVKKLQ